MKFQLSKPVRKFLQSNDSNQFCKFIKIILHYLYKSNQKIQTLISIFIKRLDLKLKLI